MTHYGRSALEVITSNAPDYEDIAEGEQRKYNHTDCPAGEDTKHRLYIKNVDGAYMWHCHNCGESGYYRPKETAHRIRTESEFVRLPTEHKYTPIVTGGYSELDEKGKLWLSEYEFDEEMANKFRIRAVDDGVWLPIYLYASIKGHQIRRYNRSPKYLTATQQPFSYFLINEKGDFNRPLIVVEDLLSSYKLNHAGFSSLALLGTKLQITSSIADIINNYKRIVLWLDDDTAGHAAAIKLYKQLSPVVKDVTTMFLEQPKEMPLESLYGLEL